MGVESARSAIRTAMHLPSYMHAPTPVDERELTRSHQPLDGLLLSLRLLRPPAHEERLFAKEGA